LNVRGKLKILNLYIVYIYFFRNSISTSKPSSSSTNVDDETEDILLIDHYNTDESSSSAEMTYKKIHFMLKNSLKIVSYSKKHTSNCWTRFSFPAVLDDNDKIVKKFNDFVSCKNCFVTYSFKSNSTSQINKHKCDDSSLVCSSTSSQNKPQSLKQSKITPYSSKTPQSIKLEECEKNRTKKLLVDWVCTDIRPFSVINDHGLRSLVQECILLGISYISIDSL